MFDACAVHEPTRKNCRAREHYCDLLVLIFDRKESQSNFQFSPLISQRYNEDSLILECFITIEIETCQVETTGEPMKTLPSSMREKKRYLLFEILCEGEIDRQQFIREMWRSASSLYGDAEVSRLDLWLTSFNGNKGIIRCAHDKTEEVRALLAAISSINGNQAGIRVLKTSGTINTLKESFIQG